MGRGALEKEKMAECAVKGVKGVKVGRETKAQKNRAAFLSVAPRGGGLL